MNPSHGVENFLSSEVVVSSELLFLRVMHEGMYFK